jgi:hypothetical protein
VRDLADLDARRACDHLARDRREHAIKLLDALSAPQTLVDVPWTPKQKNGVKADNDKPGDRRLNSEAL